MEQPCLLYYCFYACLLLSYIYFIRYSIPCCEGEMHQRAHFSADELVSCSACAHQFMLGLEIRPRPAGAESDAALPGFQSSYLSA